MHQLGSVGIGHDAARMSGLRTLSLLHLLVYIYTTLLSYIGNLLIINLQFHTMLPDSAPWHDLYQYKDKSFELSLMEATLNEGHSIGTPYSN